MGAIVTSIHYKKLIHCQSVELERAAFLCYWAEHLNICVTFTKDSQLATLKRVLYGNWTHHCVTLQAFYSNYFLLKRFKVAASRRPRSSSSSWPWIRWSRNRTIIRVRKIRNLSGLVESCWPSARSMEFWMRSVLGVLYWKSEPLLGC